MNRTLIASLVALTIPALALAVSPVNPVVASLTIPANPEFETLEVVSGPPIGNLNLNLEEASFDEASRTLSIVAPLVNQTDTFTPELTYTLSLYRGAPVRGTVEGLDLATFATGKIPGIAPNSVSEPTISMKVPESVDPGTYAIRVAINDVDMSFFGLDVYPEGVALSGKGGHLGYPNPFVFFKDGNLADLTAGVALEKGEGMSIGLDTGVSSALRAAIAAGDDFTAEAVAYDLRGQEAHRFTSRPMSVVTVGASRALAVDFEAWDSAPGPYTLKVTVYQNGQRAALDVIEARWLVDGFVSRILGVDSFANSYRKGDAVDVFGTVSAFGQAGGESATLKISLIDRDGATQSFEKTIRYVEGQEFFDFDFSDQRVARDAEVSRVEAVLTDSSGIEVDRLIVNVESGKAFPAERATTSPIPASLAGLAATMALAGLGFAYSLHRGHRAAAVGFFVAAAAVVAVMVFYGDALAKKKKATTTNKASTAAVWFVSGDTGSQGICPETVDVTFAGHAYCPHCMNGTQWVGYVTYTYSDGTTAQSEDKVGGFPGGMDNNFAAGPFTVSIPIGGPGKELVSYAAVGYVRRYPGWYHGFCDGSAGVATVYHEASCYTSEDICPEGNCGGCTGGDCGGCGSNQKECNGVCVSLDEDCGGVPPATSVEECVFQPEEDQYCIEIFDASGQRTDQLSDYDAADLAEMFGPGLAEATDRQREALAISAETYPVWGVVGRAISGSGGIDENYGAAGCAGALCAYGEQGCLTSTDVATGRKVGNCCPIGAAGASKEAEASIEVEPSIIARNGQCDVFWSSHEMARCELSGTGVSSTALAGRTKTPSLQSTSIYTLTCTGLDGAGYVDTAACTVNPNPNEF